MAGEEVIETGEQLAAALEAGLTLGKHHATINAVKGSIVRHHGHWCMDVRLALWDLGEAGDRSVREVKQQEVQIASALPVSLEGLVAYLGAIGALLDEQQASTLERCTPADFFHPEVLRAGGDFAAALRERFGPDVWLAWYDIEVKSGGHRHYFFNTACRFWREVLPLLDTARAKILAEAVAVFGEGGPAEHVAARRAQLAAFTPVQVHALTQLDERYLNEKLPLPP